MQDIEVDGYRVKAGTFVCCRRLCAPAGSRGCGTGRLEFDPDRFRPESAKQIDRWQYLPFGAGPRTCVGDHFAMLELALALATIVRHERDPFPGTRFPMATPFTIGGGRARSWRG